MHAMSRLLKHIFTDIIFLGILLHVSVEWPEKFQLFILFCGVSECGPMRVHFRGAALSMREGKAHRGSHVLVHHARTEEGEQCKGARSKACSLPRSSLNLQWCTQSCQCMRE